MNETQRYVPPLAIFILWHPSFTGAEELPKAAPVQAGTLLGLQEPREKTNAEVFVDRIIELLRGPRNVVAERIPIEVRSPPVPGAEAGLPLEINFRQADRTLVVPLIDDTLMTDNAWTRWIKELAGKENVHVRPVAISKHGVNLFKGQHPSRLFEHDVDDRPDVLFRDLLVYCAWLLNGSAPKLFLSYHKDEDTGDDGHAAGYRGDKIAAALHHTIISNYKGVEWFFAPESMFLTELYKARILKEVSESSALISVLTSRYHEREWCRLEVTAARQPREIKEGTNCWTLTPLLLVDGLIDSCSMLWREFGGCYMARWTPESADSTSKEIIDRALHEIVMSSFSRCWAEKLAGDGEVIINWIPDPLSILKLTELASDLPNATVVYPGHGFSKEDRRFLESTLSGITFRHYREQMRLRQET